MSICLLPSATVFPSIRLCDDLFDELGHLERSLRHLNTVVPKKLCRDRTIEKVTDDESKLSLTLDVSHFKPEELKVNLDGRRLTVEGKQEVKDEQSYLMRSFTRHWVLPESIDIEKIHSSLTSEGNLVIEAPKIARHAIRTRSIPIVKTQEEPKPVDSA